MRSEQDAEDVAHDFLIRVLTRGFVHALPDRGIFRYYLRTAVRNAAMEHLRKQQLQARTQAHLLAQALALEDQTAKELSFDQSWTSCLLERAREKLRQEDARNHQQFSLILQVSTAYGDESPSLQAARISALRGTPMRADAFRKALSRARQRFARLLVEEVRSTLEIPTSEALELELCELGLLPYVQGVLVDVQDNITSEG